MCLVSSLPLSLFYRIPATKYMLLFYIYFRIWLVVSSQININTAFEQDLMEIKTTNPKDILVLGPCLHFNPMNNTIRCVGEDIYKYPDILQVICS